MPTLRPVPIALVLALIAAAPARPRLGPGAEMRAARTDPPKYTLDEATVRIEKVGTFVRPAAIGPAGAGDAIPELGEVVNLGRKVWKVVVDNEPVVDVRAPYATALPKGASGWTDLAGWRPPAGEVYELTARNGYGARVIRARYQVLRTYGGSYHGRGKYLTAVAVEPLRVEVAWAYRLSMEAAVPDSSVVNVGTSRDPVAGMMATLSWRVSTPLKDARGRSLYFLQGDGAYREIGGPFSEGRLDRARARLGAVAAGRRASRARVDRTRGEALG